MDETACSVTYNKAGTGTPRRLTHPNTRGALPERASESNIRELA